MYEIIADHVQRAAKAWIAAVLPVLVGLVANTTNAMDIDFMEWVGILSLSTAQWVGVYYKTNYEIDRSEVI